MKKYLGIELGSTRIKAVLIDENAVPLATGTHAWENRFENGHWTYAYADIWAGLQSCYAALAEQFVRNSHGLLTTLDGIGVSAMMHGYIPLGSDGRELAPFRTWRNTNTGEAARTLSEAFDFNIPLRWSIAHLHQARLDGEAHVHDIAFLTTLAGYVHYKLTGEKVLGVGDASGMFPIAACGTRYDAGMVEKYKTLGAQPPRPPLFANDLCGILPRVLQAGDYAGTLTAEGVALFDPTGTLRPGIPFCPPEGDAGTGMVATHSVAARTGNVSAGTSIFAMLVLDAPLGRRHPEIDLVTTPDGKPVAMVHCNNCSTDIDAWVRLFMEAATALGAAPTPDAAYEALFRLALEGEPDGGGLTAVSYHSGEHNTGFTEGRPLLVRTPDARFTPANVMRTLLYSAVATLRLGMDILTEKENVRIEKILGHGGLFTVPLAAQKLLAGALNTPVSVMDTAGEGGAWGIALLAAFMGHKGKTLDAFLDAIFRHKTGAVTAPAAEDAQGFNAYLEKFKAALYVERAAVEML